MASRLNSKTNILVTIVGILAIQIVISPFPISATETDTISDSGSEEENEVDLTDGAIPWSLRNVLTEEIANYPIPFEIKSRFPYFLSGFDYEGRAVWVAEAGKWDIRYMIEGGSEHMMDICLFQGIYTVLNSSGIMATEEDPVDDVLIIVDLDGFGVKQISHIPTLKYILQQFKTFLPAFKKLYKAVLINTNFAAETLLNLIRPFLGSEFNKVEVYGNVKAKWLPQLLKIIPRDQLPESYGGDPDFEPYQLFNGILE